MDATEAQPGVAITHGQLEDLLQALPVRPISSCLWQHMVRRLDRRHFQVDGGEPMRLLPTIDAVTAHLVTV
jgi:hypothetical protein